MRVFFDLLRWHYWYHRGTRCLAIVIGKYGFKARAGRVIVYSGVSFEIKFMGRHRGFDVVFFNL